MNNSRARIANEISAKRVETIDDYDDDDGPAINHGQAKSLLSLSAQPLTYYSIKTIRQKCKNTRDVSECYPVIPRFIVATGAAHFVNYIKN